MAYATQPVNRTTYRRSQNRAAWLFVLPFLGLFIALFVFPLFYSAYLSLFQTRLIGGESFAGIANYVRVFSDPSFWRGAVNVGLFLIIQVPIMLCLALFFALALDSKKMFGHRFARLAIFVPYAVPGVVAALMWGYLYGDDFGPIAQFVRWLGLPSPNFLAPDNILGALMNITTWEFIGYNMIILYAALRTIPDELFDAAKVDGAGDWRVAWSIKIPAIRPAILLTVLFSVIGSFQLFNEPNLLYKIAPNAIGVDFTPNLYAYNVAFVEQNVNYAAAIAFTIGLITMVIAYVVQLASARKEKR